MLNSFENPHEYESYKIEKRELEYRVVNETGHQYVFLKTFGREYDERTESDEIVGRVSMGIDQQHAIGKIGFEFHRDRADNSKASVEIGPAGESILILERHRGKGLGRILAETAINWAKEVAREKQIQILAFRILINEGNIAAQKIAESLGFKAKLRAEVVFYELEV